MNDVSNRAVREFSEFLNSIEADFPKPTCTTAYEITMKSTIVQCLDYAGHRTADGRAFLEPSPGAAEHSGFPVYPVAGR